MKLYKGTRPYKIVQQLAVEGGVLLISLVNPVAGAGIVKDIMRQYFRGKYFERQRFLNDLAHLQRRELIDWKETPDGMVRMTLTKNGRVKILEYKLDEMRVEKPARWDRKWRLVVFDVPVDKKQARDALGVKLVELGFYPLQRRTTASTARITAIAIRTSAASSTGRRCRSIDRASAGGS